MYLWSTLHFICFLTYLCISVVILSKNPRSNLNRACFGFITCFSIWSFGNVITQNPLTPKGLAELFFHIDAIGWIYFGSFYIWFTLIFVEKEKILRPKWIPFILIAVPLLLYYAQWNDLLTANYIKQPYGWSYGWSKSIWKYLFCSYFAFCMSFSIILIFNLQRATKSKVKKRQALIISATTLASFILGSTSDILIREFNIHVFPVFGDVFSLIWVSGMVYSIRRYRLFSISPAAAAENVFSAISEGLILADKNGNIVRANKKIESLSGFKEKEIIGKSIGEVFEWGAVFLDAISKMQDLNNYEFTLKNKAGDSIPTLISSSILRDEDGASQGIVWVIRDITDRKKAENIGHFQYDLAKALNAARRLEDGLRLCIETALVVSGMECGGIYLFDKVSGGLKLTVHKGLSPDYVKAVSHYDKDSMNARLVKEGKAVYSRHSELGLPLTDAEIREGLKAFTIIPVYHEKQVIGCVNISSRSVSNVPLDVHIALETIVAGVGGAISRLEIEKELEDRVRELEVFHKAAVGRELKMIELKEKISRLEGNVKNKVQDKH